MATVFLLLLSLQLAGQAQGIEEKPFVPQPVVVKGMVAALRDPSPAVAAFAAKRLGDWRRAEVATEMERLLAPETPAPVRNAALLYFTRIGEAARPHLAAVLKQAGDEATHVREMVLSAVLSAKGAAAHLNAIVPMLKDPRVEVRSLAAECLGQAGEAARVHLPALREALNRARASEFRRAVLSAMESVGGLSIQDGASFVPFLDDKDEEVRIAAFGAIETAVATAGGADSAAAAALEQAARAQFAKENPEVRAAMIEGAVHGQRIARAMMGVVLSELSTGSPVVQVAALQALSAAKEAALPHLAEVSAKLGAAEPEVRAAAFRALRSMGQRAVAPQLNAVALALRHDSAEVRNEALLALPLAGEALKAFPYRIRTAISGASPGVQNTLLKAAGVLVEKTGVDDEWLAQGREALASPQRDMRMAMCLVASRFGMKNGSVLFPQLVELLKDRDSAVRGAAAIALRAFAVDDVSRATLRVAVRPLLADADDEVRWAALDTAFELQPAGDAEFVAAIASSMDDEEEGVRSAAVRALGACGSAGKRYLPRILESLEKERAIPPSVVVETVLRLSPLEPAELALLLQTGFVYDDLVPLLRTTAYAAAAGDARLINLVRLAGRSTGSTASLIAHAEAPQAAATLREALRGAGLNPQIRAEMESRLNDLTSMR